MTKLPIPQQIWYRLKSTDLSLQDKTDLLREFSRYKRLRGVLQSSWYKKTAAKRVKKPKPAKIRPTSGKGSGICGLCKTPLPHSTRVERQKHMLNIKRKWMQRASQAKFREIGWDKFWKPGHEAIYRRAIRVRTAIFREITNFPMKNDELERLINTRRFGKTRYLEPLCRWRQFVTRNYGRR